MAAKYKIFIIILSCQDFRARAIKSLLSELLQRED